MRALRGGSPFGTRWPITVDAAIVRRLRSRQLDVAAIRQAAGSGADGRPTRGKAHANSALGRRFVKARHGELEATGSHRLEGPRGNSALSRRSPTGPLVDLDSWSPTR